MPFSMLDGIRVVDLSRHVPGPYATSLLANHGAEVIMVEDMMGSDPLRNPRPEFDDLTPQYSFHCNKKSLLVNLKSADGREAFLRLAASADALLEGFRPGVMARLGLGYDELRAVNSRLVYCSLSGYGQSGPYRTRVGHDINYMALSGALDLIGSHDGPPVVPGLQVADLSGGMVACISILMGLLQRQRTGEGCYCDVAMMDCVVSLLALQSEQAFASGVTPRRGSERLNGGIACFNVYRTKDGRYLSLGNLEPKFWQVFCELIERPDLVARQYDALPDHPELRAVMDDIMAGRSLAEWEALLSDTEVAWAPVLDLPEVFANPQVVARGMRRDDVVPGVIQTGSPLTLPNESASPDQAPPPRGSHTASLLREFGYADEEIARLASEKAIGLAQ